MKKIPQIGLVFIILLASGVMYAYWSGGFNYKKKVETKKDKSISEKEAYQYLRKLLSKYSDLSEYFVEIDYELMDENDQSYVIDRFSGLICFNQNNQYLKSYDSETIINEKYNLLISDEDKTIFIARRDSLVQFSNAVISSQLFDSIQRLALDIPVLEKLSDTLFTISYQPRFEQWRKVLIAFNPVNNTLKEVKMWLDESITDENSRKIQNPILYARYSNERFSLNQSDLIKFKTNQFLEMQNGRLVGKGKVANYMIEIQD